MTMAAKFKVPKITRASVDLINAGNAGSPSLAVSRPACPLCGNRAADTRVSVGPISMEICAGCSEPIWHGLGLAQWAKKFFK